MLGRDIVYIANWFFDSDYMSVAINVLQKFIQIILGINQTAYYVILKLK